MTTIDIELLKSHPLPNWGDETHKADRGKLLLIGGSKRIPGAAILAARAALRAGCGSVRVAAPASVAMAIGIAVPELMVVPLPETSAGTISGEAIEQIVAQSKECDTIVLGPGLDANSETDEFAREVIEAAPLPLLIDAQAISALPGDWKVAGTRARILTPHDGEFETLTGKTLGPDAQAREKAALDYVKAAGATLALKGHETIVASPGGESYLNENGTRALGTAGSGDVLAGIIGGLLAQGIGRDARHDLGRSSARRGRARHHQRWPRRRLDGARFHRAFADSAKISARHDSGEKGGRLRSATQLK